MANCLLLTCCLINVHMNLLFIRPGNIRGFQFNLCFAPTRCKMSRGTSMRRAATAIYMPYLGLLLRGLEDHRMFMRCRRRRIRSSWIQCLEAMLRYESLAIAAQQVGRALPPSCEPLRVTSSLAVDNLNTPFRLQMPWHNRIG